jgi:hypothetical protein
LLTKRDLKKLPNKRNLKMDRSVIAAAGAAAAKLSNRKKRGKDNNPGKHFRHPKTAEVREELKRRKTQRAQASTQEARRTYFSPRNTIGSQEYDVQYRSTAEYGRRGN